MQKGSTRGTLLNNLRIDFILAVKFRRIMFKKLWDFNSSASKPMEERRDDLVNFKKGR